MFTLTVQNMSTEQAWKDKVLTHVSTPCYKLSEPQYAT